MTELVERTEQLPAAPGEFTHTAWNPPDALSYDDFIRVGAALSAMQRAIHWWLGDWLNAGEDALGERYAQAVDETDFVIGTLQNDAWVSRQVHRSLRNERLSWTHHYLVAALDPEQQRQWLDRAARFDWSTRDLRQHLSEWKAQRNIPDRAEPQWTEEPTKQTNEQSTMDVLAPDGEPSAGPVLAQVQCPQCGHRWHWNGGRDD